MHKRHWAHVSRVHVATITSARIHPYLPTPGTSNVVTQAQQTQIAKSNMTQSAVFPFLRAKVSSTAIAPKWHSKHVVWSIIMISLTYIRRMMLRHLGSNGWGTRITNGKYLRIMPAPMWSWIHLVDTRAANFILNLRKWSPESQSIYQAFKTVFRAQFLIKKLALKR